ncbi:MAG: hypothetical protein E7663_03365 [Ruminococcaceae bacterium]|nr:hypothetical protein [Oscillospiraceae bacterium]
MINALSVGMMVLLYTMQSLLCKKYSDHYPGDPEMASPVFTVVSGMFVVLVAFFVSGFSFSFSSVTVLLGVINAVALFGYNRFIIEAAQSGPYSVLMVFSIAGGIVIPTAVAHLLFQESLSILKILALLVVFLAVWLISRKQGEARPKSGKFFVTCLLLGICNGTYGCLLDVQQRLTGVEEKDEMVAITYGVAVLLSFVVLAIKQKRRIAATMRQTGRSALYLAACSLAVAAAINLLVYIIPLVDLTVLYTLDNSGTMLLSVIASVIFFRERLSRTNVIGCVTMAAALVAVALL